MTTASRSAEPTAVLEPKGMERREAPRLRVPEVDAEILSLGLPAKVLDIGFGGLSIESEHEFQVGEVHTLRSGPAHPHATPLRVRVRHCRPSLSGAPRPRYVTGCEFVDPWCPGDRSAADEFISHVTSKVSRNSRH